jgi:exonuclease VII small subunit
MAVASSPEEAQQIDRLLSQANLHRLRKEWEPATDLCIQVLKLAPTNATAHSLIADIYYEEGRLEEALRWYKMAMELRPSASEKAKLEKAEKEILKQSRSSTKALRGNALPVHSDGSVVGGTTLLAGKIKPQSWLRWTTGVSLAFLGITLIGLATYRMGQRSTAKSPTSREMQSVPPATLGNTNSALPPSKPIYGTGNLPQSPPPASTPSEAGTGFAPDRPTSGTTQPTPNNIQKPQPNGSGIPAPGTDSSSLAPANVAKVVPNTPLFQPRLTAQNEEESSEDKTALPGEMWIAGINRSKGAEAAEVIIATPFNKLNEMNADQRRLLTRNVLRAGSRVFQADTTLNSLTLTVTTDPNTSAKNVQTLFTAQLDRSKLGKLDIASATKEQILEALNSYQWADDTPPPTPTPAPKPKPSKPAPQVYIELAPNKN